MERCCGTCAYYNKQADDAIYWVGPHGTAYRKESIGYGKCQPPHLPFYLHQYVDRDMGTDCPCFTEKED